VSGGALRLVRLRDTDGRPGPWCIEGREGYRALESDPWRAHAFTGEVFERQDAALAAPVSPSKVVGVGRNYRAHARELDNAVPDAPLFFLKPPSAVIGPGEAIVRPPESTRVDYEGELAVVIGRRARRVARDAALSFVYGYSIGNDVTARDLQKKDVQFTRAKGFDTFCPLGPCVVDGLDPQGLTILTRVNGELRQEGRTADMIFDVATLIAEASRVMTLLPGDVLLTGTPAGVGPLAAGDIVEVEIPGIGTLHNAVVDGEA
jgi:2-keto-4-pentenoate hydratase/2-oxohepta-3-ene-1,7-dioic acid hydratase in catechol pathway